MKKFMCLLLTGLLITGASLTSASAQMPTETSDAPYAYVVWDGQTHPLTRVETELFKTNPEVFDFYNDETLAPRIAPRAIGGYYIQSSSSKFFDYSLQQYVSACHAGGAYGTTMSVSQSVSYSASFTLGASLSGTYKNQIAATISASATLSATTSSSESSTPPVPPNMYGRIAFTPRMLRTIGTFVHEADRPGGLIVETGREPVDANFPLKLGTGLADGLYEPIYKSYPF